MSLDWELRERLDRIEKKLDEAIQLLRRRATPGGGSPASASPTPRQQSDGTWVVWGGDGTGWIPWLGPDPKKARLP